nr:polycomb protein SCMH1-like [Oncorhynchus nerka]
MTVSICSVSHPAVRSDGGIHYVKLPQASSASFVLRFMESLCHQLQSDNLFSSQPFSPAFMASTGHTAYDRSTSVKEEMSEALSIARGSVGRSRRFQMDRDRDCNLYPSPLSSSKRLHSTEAHPSEGTLTPLSLRATPGALTGDTSQ